MIDVLTPAGIAVDIHDAVGDVALTSAPELIGHLIEALVRKDVLSAEDLQGILPPGYTVRS